MAITVGNVASMSLNNSIITGATTLSHVLPAGRNRLLLAFWNENNATGITLEHNGAAMTLLFSQAGQLAGRSVNCYYLLESSLPAAGTYNVTPKGTGRAYGQLGVISVSEVSQVVADLVTSNTNTGNGQNTAARTFDTINDALLLLWAESTYAAATPTWTPTSPATEWADLTQANAPASSATGIYQRTITSGNTTLTTVNNGTGYMTFGAVRLLPNADDVSGFVMW